MNNSEVATKEETIKQYREEVLNEMIAMGASSEELALLHNETVCNAIRNNKRPEDVAWAILQ